VGAYFIEQLPLLALGGGQWVMIGLLAEQLRQAIGNLFLPGDDLGRRDP